MKNKKFSVLLDISLATLGHKGGIPHDTRVMVTLFSMLPEVDLTLLIYDPGGATLTHRFTGKRATLLEQLVNQALYLESLTSHRTVVSRNPFLRQIQKIWYVYNLFFKRTINTEKLLDTFKEVIMRQTLSYSIDLKDLKTANNWDILAASLGNSVMYTRSLFALPQPKLDTGDFDFVIFEDVRPLRVSKRTIKLVRYHDIIPLIRPDLVGHARSFIKWHFIGLKACSKDSIFICNSEPTKNDLLTYIPELENRVYVIPYPVASHFYFDSRTELLPQIVEQRWCSATGVKGPVNKVNHQTKYILHVATIEPRKNLINLIKAFNFLQKQYNDTLLMVVGNLGWQFEPILKAMYPLVRTGRLVHLEEVAPDELRLLYSHALAVCFPSYYEGFGLPPLEAMACGAPVVLSDIPAHRWVAADAGVYCNPYDPESIAEALSAILDDPFLRDSLKEKGKLRALEFSMDKVAYQWLALFEELKGSSG
ncbi:MAG: glycosyltransferase family 4 protein [archaeon YNP-WB-062]|jgi:glycosyltransferase involved in cell wall biosynthesis|nr:glycosyltransferase family 4 protein [Candidatus Culexarchaeum yellowstonense]